MQKAKVYFTRALSPEGLLKVYKKVNGDIQRKVAIKIHTGEPKGPNILPLDMVKTLYEAVPNSTLVETNTLYKGKRYSTKEHRQTIHINGWDIFANVDIMDEEGKVNFPVKDGKHFKEVSMVCADGRIGKKQVHDAPDNEDYAKWLIGAIFMENMVESDKATVNHFAPHIVYINVLRRMSA